MKNKFKELIEDKKKLENELKLAEETKYSKAFQPYVEQEQVQVMQNEEEAEIGYRSDKKNDPNRRKKIVKYSVIATVALLLATYFGGMVYYNNKYLPNTYINAQNVSNRSIINSEEEKLQVLEKDILTFKTPEHPEGKKVSIYNSPIKVEYNPIDLANQNNNPWQWLSSLFGEKKYQMKLAIRDQNDIENWLKIQGVTNNDNRIVPESASLGFENNKVIIKPENEGNAIDEEKAKNKLISSIEAGNFEIDFREEKKKVERDQLSIKKLQSEVSQIVETETFIKGPKENMKVEPEEKFNALKINPDDTIEYKKDEISKIVGKYNQLMREKEGVSSEAINLKVSSGNIQGSDKLVKSDQLEENKSIPQIGNAILDSKQDIPVQTVSKFANKIKYNDTAVLDGMFAEVNLNDQKTYIYKDGELIFQTQVVTGRSETINKDGKSVPPTPTNKGLFRVIGKYTDFTLDSSTVNVSDVYREKVRYWIPFDPVGIGFHDLQARENNASVPPDQRFAADRYKQNGSHGCINTPLGNVEKMYNILQNGTYVWVH
jgi:hypothetical protein